MSEPRADQQVAFACLYFGPRDECSECGFFNDTGTEFCSHDCAQSRADRVAAAETAVRARRAEEDAFGREVERLRGLGYSYEEMDAMLAGWPT